MNFSKLKLTKYIKEDSTEVAQMASDSAKASGDNNKQVEGPAKKNAQAYHRAKKTLPAQSEIVYNSFDISDLLLKKQLIHMREANRVNWREELELEPDKKNSKDHPYVDVMPGGETESDTRKLQKRKKNINEAS
ncbi:hypothetical protein SCRM01_126c [Synechococcus phage S-CRM01]|uniref:hypothetical protein n=1 Tax=Synechococcus phage S-CRM01 TaxID=1026955 RepID=UPI000209E3BA|nr:hypothetical protein SCRM01_126c [Synechococcus phage S-CRM01]AEC53072.1 hypothetical protein SCRM01_126c [Synechococcus phage S-CRM01]